ncbi:hypothetical protein CONCODRAFT_73890 [Conidiobolus coronatus NRRL 28638]|uniref:Uncharacterized protein n=1 Tax=Conidiobolus coronatus (strain ATCC 28846 / CBS 209.66 / NRRL 28638) TaxID=796925 RepID=A0A137NU25_CONC2|nr:hypothetical protein CONCODRAFT_73890 [Conidiobolus coronatus NRRL 28638]|eukprot:KXN66124.1 hypothetical protein CONCODRAFT_73890 [Conidiobolus coronatus NRRL 28638]
MIYCVWIINWLLVFSGVALAEPNPLFKGLMNAVINEFGGASTTSKGSETPTKTSSSSSTKATASTTTSAGNSKETSKNPNALSNLFDSLFNTPKQEEKIIPASTIKKNLSKDVSCDGCRDDQLCKTRCQLESKMMEENPVLIKFCDDSCGPVPGCIRICIIREYIPDPPMVATYQYALFRLDNCTIDVGRRYTQCAVNCKKSSNYSDCEADCFNNIHSFEDQCWQSLSQLPSNRVQEARQCAVNKCTFGANKDMTLNQFYSCYLGCYEQMYYAMGWLTNHRGHNIDLDQLDKLFSNANKLSLNRVTLGLLAISLLYQLVF